VREIFYQPKLVQGEQASSDGRLSRATDPQRPETGPTLAELRWHQGETHKADVFTKHLDPTAFEKGTARIGMK